MNPFTEALQEKARIVGKINLPGNVGKPTKNPDFITKADLDALEKVLDRLFAHYKIDITFTKHFKDRMNDARNKKQITIEELAKLFRKAHDKAGKTLVNMKDIQGVLTDLQSKVNVPFVIVDKKGKGLELVSKTVMRKANFKTSSKKIQVEGMKSYSEFVNEMMEPEEFHQDAQDAVDYLKGELTRIFRGQEVICVLRKKLGLHVIVGVYNAPRGCSDLDRMNAPSSAQFIMHLSSSFGKVVPMAKFSFEKNAIRGNDFKKVAFRKTTGKSPTEAAKKLVAWFNKNKHEFLYHGAKAR